MIIGENRGYRVQTTEQIMEHQHVLVGLCELPDASGILKSIPLGATGGKTKPTGHGTIDYIRPPFGNDEYILFVFLKTLAWATPQMAPLKFVQSHWLILIANIKDRIP